LSWIFFGFWVRFLLCSTSIFMPGKAHGSGLYQNPGAPLTLASRSLILVKPQPLGLGSGFTKIWEHPWLSPQGPLFC
jgi:hypothetical protein